ncbi:MAG: NUDIX domain-containing protein [Lentisphaeria bacterium]|jgi:isopentenyldiphosphate isomerase
MTPPTPADSEEFDVYDAAGNHRGRRPRRECHGNPALIHRTAHVVVFARDGRLLLQKRPAHKDIQPGKWDTAVGGHLAPGESWEQAARRELAEELGIPGAGLPLEFLFTSQIRNEVESEDVGVFALVHDGPFHPPPAEIDELRFWSTAELRRARGGGLFTPSLDAELDRLAASGRLQL